MILQDKEVSCRFELADENGCRMDETAVYSGFSEMAGEARPVAAFREYSRIRFLFDSDDPGARLYLDGFDLLPERETETDGEGAIFVRPSGQYRGLTETEEGFFPFRVGRYGIRIVLGDRTFLAIFEILPAHLSQDEWEVMREELEDAIESLSRHVISRNSGILPQEGLELSPALLYRFLILQKHYHEVRGALLDLRSHPNYTVLRDYRWTREEKAPKVDQVSLRRMLRRGEREGMELSRSHRISYDLPENRWLKKMLSDYRKELSLFRENVSGELKKLEEKRREYQKYREGTRKKAAEQLIRRLTEFREMAAQISGVAGLLESAAWYRELQGETGRFLPHAVARDARYAAIYRLHRELRKESLSLQLRSFASYGWETTDRMYEMWCFLKLTLYLSGEAGFKVSGWVTEDGHETFRVTDLLPGTCLKLTREKTELLLYYDTQVPPSRREMREEDGAVFSHGRHRRPDGRMDFLRDGQYLGTIVFDCKYRQVRSFWDGIGASSSAEQLRAYKNEFQSPYLDEDESRSMRLFRPVFWVWVFYPGNPEERKAETLPEEGICFLPLRPGSGNVPGRETGRIIRQQMEEILSQSGRG